MSVGSADSARPPDLASQLDGQLPAFRRLRVVLPGRGKRSLNLFGNCNTVPAEFASRKAARMHNQVVQGVMPVVILPYNADFTIDEGYFRRQIEHVLAVGCDGIVMAQVSEVSRLTARERFAVADLMARHSAAGVYRSMSTGGESITQAVDFSRQAQAADCSALLVMHPSMPALDDEEMYRYFAAVVEAADMPVLVHHAEVSQEAALDRRPGPAAAGFRGGQGAVQPGGPPTPPRVSALLEATGGQARIFEGDGGMMLLDTFRRGLAGVIPATARCSCWSRPRTGLIPNATSRVRSRCIRS